MPVLHGGNDAHGTTDGAGEPRRRHPRKEAVGFSPKKIGVQGRAKGEGAYNKYRQHSPYREQVANSEPLKDLGRLPPFLSSSLGHPKLRFEI